MLRDITRKFEPGMAVWPGDTPYQLNIAQWGALRVGAITASLHCGTHADAPCHFAPEGTDVLACDLETYVGPAVVVDVRGRDSITPDDIGPIGAPRVLLRTDAWIAGTPFPDRIPVITPEAVTHLRRHGVRLLGLDVPSVDQIDSKTLDNHHALNAAGIAIVESLDLAEAPTGTYPLVALPLPIEGGDASPVRAILISHNESNEGARL